jgi:hypothetical protein
MKKLILLLGICCAGISMSYSQTSKGEASPDAVKTNEVKAPPSKVSPAKATAPAEKSAPAAQKKEAGRNKTESSDPKKENNAHANTLPGEMHNLLAAEAGTWKEEFIIYPDKNSSPLYGSASCIISMIHGNRYQQAVHSGKLGNQEFTGTGMVGYDNVSRQFVSTWVDNTGTSTLITYGQYDREKGVIVFTGTMPDPVTGKTLQVREDYYLVDDNTRRMEMFIIGPEEEEFKSMEINMKR